MTLIKWPMTAVNDTIILSNCNRTKIPIPTLDKLFSVIQKINLEV